MCYFEFEGNKVFFEEAGCENDKHLLLLHGNTVSSRFFAPIIPLLSKKYHVITIDFIGNGGSDRIDEGPEDLWYEWGKQAVALINHLELTKVNVIGCSGGALAALNLVLEYPELINAVIADSFEGLVANAEITDQIRMGRDFAKTNEGFCSMLKMMHGEDWESVLDADTNAVVNHALHVVSFCHGDIGNLTVPVLVTGSNEDEMFPKNHFTELFDDMCKKNKLIKAHIFEHGQHPAMMSNMDEFVKLCEEFFGRLIFVE